MRNSAVSLPMTARGAWMSETAASGLAPGLMTTTCEPAGTAASASGSSTSPSVKRTSRGQCALDERAQPGCIVRRLIGQRADANGVADEKERVTRGGARPATGVVPPCGVRAAQPTLRHIEGYDRRHGPRQPGDGIEEKGDEQRERKHAQQRDEQGLSRRRSAPPI